MKTKYTDCLVPREYVEANYRLLKTVTNVLKYHNITHWIDGGTLLAWYRHKNFIMPHDDDTDLAVEYRDWERLIDVLPIFEKLGFKVEKSIYCAKVIDTRYKNLENGKIIVGKPACDLFCYRNINRKYVLANVGLEKVYPNAFHYTKDVLPLKPVKYCSIQTYIPNRGMGYCNRLYPNWQKDIVVQIRDKDNARKKNKFLIFPSIKNI